MIKKLRQRITLMSMLLTTLVMVAICFGMFNLIKLKTNSEAVQALANIAQMANINADNNADGSAETPSKLGNVSFPYFTVEIGENSSYKAVSDGQYDLYSVDNLDSIVATAVFSKQENGYINDAQLRFMKFNTPGGSTKIVFMDVSSVSKTMSSVKLALTLGFFASFIVFFIISAMFAKWAVKPVEKAWDQQRKFVGDASHELKTPLTVITTNAELLNSPDCTEEEVSKYSSNILTVSGSMRNLIEGLLNLSRADDGKDKEHFEKFNFSEAVSDASMQFEPVFFEKGLELQEEIAEGIIVNGSMQKLSQVVSILLDNACKYSDPGTTVLKLERQNKNVVLSVTNPGTPLTPQQCQDIFKRFYRTDESRNAKDSFGLGLSIADSIITEHGGSIHAEGKDGKNSFIVKLPVC